jgi:glycosyltransferase involved in cell wall biosynthesis
VTLPAEGCVGPSVEFVAEPLRILFLSWRDPENPKAGGAELFTHEVASRLVDGGDSVEWFTASFPGAAPEVDLAGVRVVRSGRQWTVHLAAMRRYRGRLNGAFDAVVDEVNTIPFFTPLWAGIPHLLLIFQLAREVWWHESPFPLNAAGYAAEPLYLRAYRNTHALTISRSTEQDLRRLGFRAPVTILPIGLEPIRVPTVQKAQPTTFLYVGRMAPSKRVADIIHAFARFQSGGRKGQLWLVGEGSTDYLASLRTLADSLGIAAKVDFLGRLPAEEKHERMARASVLLMASAREGWGLAVAEANALGTPAVVYDVPGLRDAVRDGETGLVVGATPEALADGMIRITADAGLRERLTAEARRWSATFSFQAAAEALRSAIVAEVEAARPGHGSSTSYPKR